MHESLLHHASFGAPSAPRARFELREPERTQPRLVTCPDANIAILLNWWTHEGK